MKHGYRKTATNRPVLVQHRTTEQALPCNTHTSTQRRTIRLVPLHISSIPSLDLETTAPENHAAPTLLPGWRLSLSQQMLQGFSSWLTPGAGACCNIPVTYCIAFQRSESGCSSRAHMALSAGGVLCLARFSVWRVIACALDWGFLAAVRAHPSHCLWCMLNKQSPGSS